MRQLISIPLLSAALLAACTPEERSAYSNIVISHVNPTALSMSYVSDWSIYESAAAALRDSSPRYTVQNISGFWGPSAPDSYSLKHGRVEYAHAAGLTGAGEVISVVDFGFLQSHAEFSGKPIFTPPGYAPGIDDHGTGVAAVAAGSATSGNMIGVAPGASLALGDVTGWLSNQKANEQAMALGAVAQNNSWGLIDSSGNELAATQANFNSYLGSGSAASFMNSLSNLANNTVIVFAVSNDETRSTIDLMAGLPLFDSGLRESWISVINAVPVFQSGSVTAATVVSSDCLEAAAWCMAADGTVYAADAAHNSSYTTTTGSSFAAPQIAGGLALLAEAFPTLSREELRARMLASADNGFYTHTGYVEFADGVSHGFNSKFGHGFMNLKAALSPIGGSYIPRANGLSRPLEQPTIASTGMAGNVISRSLEPQNLHIQDGLGAGFDVSASLLTAEVIHQYDPLDTIQNLFDADLDMDHLTPFGSDSLFAAVDTGQEVDFSDGDHSLTVLLPTSDESAFGIAVSKTLDIGAGRLKLGVSAIQESDGFAGIKPLLDGDRLSAFHTGVNLAYNAPLGTDQSFLLSTSLGVASPNGSLTDMGLETAAYNSLAMTYSMANLFSTGDRFSLGLALPNALQSGSARIVMPMARSGGGFDFNSVSVPLATKSRQLDISASYGFSLFDEADVVFSAVRRLNDGNVAGQDTTETGFGFQYRF